jgi:hypothetical protein
MLVHIYDTHVTSNTGQYVHFDVLVNDANVVNVQKYAAHYLANLGIEVKHVAQSRCNFCHSEVANKNVQSDIENQGYSIIRLN